MTDFDFNESNAGCLDNETNKETLRKHILDSFNEAYTVNGAVLLDAGIYLNSLSFFNLLGIKINTLNDIVFFTVSHVHHCQMINSK